MIKKILILVLCLVSYTTSFYFTIGPNQPKCFNSTVYLNERLLIEVESPVLDPGSQAYIKVYRGAQMQYNQELIGNSAKITVNRPEVILKDATENVQILEYSTCLQVNPRDASVGGRDKYMFSLRLMTNFDYILEKKLTLGANPARDQNLQTIDQLSTKIIDLNTEQIQMHHKYTLLQRQTDQQIMTMKEKIHMYTLLQCAIVVGTAILQIYLLSRYLVGNCLI